MAPLATRLDFRTLLAAFLLLGIAACDTEQPVLDADKALFLRAAELADFGMRYRNPEAYEKFSKTRRLDGGYDLTYEFKTPESERAHPLSIFISVSVQAKASNAVMAEGAEKFGLLIGLKQAGIEEREVAGAHRFGDSSRFSVLVKGDKPVGNLFAVREGRKTYLLVIAGLYFEDPDLWKGLIGPKVQHLATYSPS